MAIRCAALAVSPKDGSIASGDDSGEIRLWDGKTGALKKIFAHQGGGVGLASLFARWPLAAVHLRIYGQLRRYPARL